MSIKLNIEVISPMTPDDHELLSGIAVMTLAIANRELAKQGFPDTFPDDEEAPPKEIEDENGHRHHWVPGFLAIEDCNECGERRLAPDQVPQIPDIPTLRVN